MNYTLNSFLINHIQLNSKTFTSASDIWKEVMYYINILVLIIRWNIFAFNHIQIGGRIICESWPRRYTSWQIGSQEVYRPGQLSLIILPPICLLSFVKLNSFLIHSHWNPLMPPSGALSWNLRKIVSLLDVSSLVCVFIFVLSYIMLILSFVK